jgi:hypothetical protein
MRSGYVWLVTAAIGVGVLCAPGTGAATVLCKSKKGGLVIRDACKKKDVQVDASILGDLGLDGPPGPAGPAGPAGPSGGGLSVVDSGGKDVGIVYAIGTGYYGGTYTNVMKELTPAGGASDFFAFGVSSAGFVTSEDYYGYGLYQASDCTGPKFSYIDCEYGSCDTAPMFTSLTIDDGLVGSYFRPAERIHGNFFSSSIFSASTAEQVASSCTGNGGTIQGAVTACEKDPQSFCGTCCSASPDIDAAPLRAIDLNPLGLVPPFKLHR